jgi:hypothetical protein
VSVFRLLRPHAGTTFCVADLRGFWAVWAFLSFEFHPFWIKFGVSLRPWTAAVYLGPFVLCVGKRRWGKPSYVPWISSSSGSGYTVTISATDQAEAL